MPEDTTTAVPQTIPEPQGEVQPPPEDSEETPVLETADATTPGGETEGAKTEEVEKTEPAPSLDPKLLLRAARAGLNDDETLACGTNEELTRMLGFVERRNLLERNREERPAAGEPEEPLELDLPDGEFDEKLVGALGKMQKHFEKKIAGMETELRRNAEELYWDRVDAGFDALPAEWKPILGEGDWHSMDKNSEAFQARTRLIKSPEFKAIMAQQMESGRLNFRDLIAKSAALVFSKDAAKIATQALVKKVEKRQGQRIAQPAQRKNPNAENLSPAEKAFQAMEEVDRRYGVTSDKL